MVKLEHLTSPPFFPTLAPLRINFKHEPFRPTSTLLLLGVAGILTGVAFKLNHLMGAETVFNIGAVILVVGLLFAVRDVWKNTMG